MVSLNLLKNKDILIVLAIIMIPTVLLRDDYSWPGLSYFFFCLFALIPAIIAARKGRNLVLWFIYSMLLWLIAFIHSLCIKENERSKASKGWHRCPYCGELSRPEATVCHFCGRDLFI